MRQRRQEQTPVSPQQARKLPRAQSHPPKVISSRPTGPFSERRRYERGPLSIPYRLRFQGKELSGYTEDISSHGLGLVSDPYLSLGTPLSLHLATQNECLSLLGCNGPGQAKKFSDILAATALAGEVAICAKVANGTFADAHKKYGRRYRPCLFAQPRS